MSNRATRARLTLIAAALLVSAGGCRALPGKRLGRKPDVVTIAGVGAPPKREVARSERPDSSDSTDSSISSRVDPMGLSERVGQVRGRVVDDRGVPVSEARVRLAVDGSPGGREVVGNTNRSGEFLLKGLRPGERYTLIAERDRGRDLLVGRASVASPDESVEIRVTRRPSSETRDRPTSSTFRLDDSDTSGPPIEEFSRQPARARFREGPTPGLDEPRSAEAPADDPVDDRPNDRGAGWVPKDNVRRVALQSDDLAESGSSTSENHFGLDPDLPAPASIEPNDTNENPSGTASGAMPSEINRADLPDPSRDLPEALDDLLPQPLPNPRPAEPPRARPPTVDAMMGDGDRPTELSPGRSSPAMPDRSERPGPPVRQFAPKRDREIHAESVGPDRAIEDAEGPSNRTSSASEAPNDAPLASRTAGLMSIRAAAPDLAQSTPAPSDANASRPDPAVETSESPGASRPSDSGTSDAEQTPLAALPSDPFADLPLGGIADAPRAEPAPAFPQGGGAPIRWADLPEPERLASGGPAVDDANESAEPDDSKRRRPFDFLAKWAGARSEDGAATPSTATACRFDPERGRLESLEIVALNGDRITLDDQPGSHLLLVFWGAWSDYSIAAMPHLVELEEQFGDDRLRVVGIASPRDGDGERRAVLRATRRLGINFPVAFSPADEADPVAEALDVRYYPTFILIDPAGNVIGRETGTTEESLARLDRSIASALDESILTASKR